MSSTSLMAKQTRIITEHLPSAPFPVVPCTSTPAANTTLDSGDTGSGGSGTAIETTTVYRCDGNASRLLIYDVTNPAAMSKIGDQLLNAGAFAVNQPGAHAIGVLNKIAYIASYNTPGTCLFAAYDCTVPGAVSQLGTFSLGGASSTSNAQRVGVSVVGGDTFCFVAINDIVNVIKVTNPAAMVSVATVTVPDVAGNGTDGLYLFQNILYATTLGLLSNDFRAKAWNVSVPSAPSLMWDTAIPGDVFTLPDIYAVNQSGSPIVVVLVQGNVGRGGIQVLNGTTGAILGTLVFTTSGVGVDAQIWINPGGSCCEIAMAGASALLRLVDISNTSAPTVRSSLGLSGQYHSVVGLSNGTPTNIYVTGNVGGGNFSLKIESVNV